MPIPKTLPERACAVMCCWAEMFPHTRAGETMTKGVPQALLEEGWTGPELAEATKHCVSQGWVESENSLALMEAGHDRFWY